MPDGLDKESNIQSSQVSRSSVTPIKDGELPDNNTPTWQSSAIENSSNSQQRPSDAQDNDDDEKPPPLPSRPKEVTATDQTPLEAIRLAKRSSRPQLQSKPTTALSFTDGLPVPHDGDSTPKGPSRTVSRKASHNFLSPRSSRAVSEAAETSSIQSFVPSINHGGQTESLLGEVAADQATPAWKALSAQLEIDNPFDHNFGEDEIFSLKLHHEFDQLETLRADGSNEELLMSDWTAKLKHFLILSSSGKPIWSRHGDDQLISNYVGIVQTIISFYQGADDVLRGFTAGNVRFVILSKGWLHLIAISKLHESDAQLRVQLDSLYMQILSTLTLPSMERMFSNRPSTDLRRPLQGTEVLLDALADGFTRGSPSTLLSALECLRLRKSHRRTINDSLLKVRTSNLLYGLIVADGRLVSVMRPKKHSLHPGDLQLIFNMLFEAGSVKAAGGENWIPLCLPGFNNTGYLYMYVSFLSTSDDQLSADERPASGGMRRGDEVAFIFISANKESFYELRQMRDDLVQLLTVNGSMAIIKSAARKGHQTCGEMLPGTSIKHFIYKSKGNVQFTMPSFEPHFHGLVARRKLLSLYGTLHASIHARTAHLKVQHCVAHDAISLAWETPLFELYCVAGPNISRAALAQGANKAIQWVRREEERVFIIGGAVF